MKSVVFASEARDEFETTASFYEVQQAGLGEAFLAELQISMRKIAIAPLAFPIDAPTGARKFIMRRFPYTLYFRELDDSVWIAAVAHSTQAASILGATQAGATMKFNLPAFI